jgi:hypothetical protein
VKADALLAYGLVPASAGPLMMRAPEGSFASAARSAASSGVLDSPAAGFAGGRIDPFCFVSDASGFAGATLSSDGATSLEGFDDGGFTAVVVSAAHADRAMPAMTKPTPFVRRMTLCSLSGNTSRPEKNSRCPMHSSMVFFSIELNRKNACNSVGIRRQCVLNETRFRKTAIQGDILCGMDDPKDIFLWTDCFWCFREEFSDDIKRDKPYAVLEKDSKEWTVIMQPSPLHKKMPKG